jgi:CHAT domain-containing protein
MRWLSLTALMAILLFGTTGSALSEPGLRVVTPAEAAAIEAAVASGDLGRLRAAAARFAPSRRLADDERLAAVAARVVRRCREAGACDTYYPLRYVHRTADPSDSRLRLWLAREYLAIDLPWYTLKLLADPEAQPLGSEQIALFQKAKAAALVMFQDSALVAAQPEAPDLTGRIAQRLWLLLGIPPEGSSGKYDDLAFGFSPRGAGGTDQEFLEDYGVSRAFWNRAHRPNATLSAIFARAARPDVERIYNLRPPEPVPGMAIPVSAAALDMMAGTGGEALSAQYQAFLSSLAAQISSTANGAVEDFPPLEGETPAARLTGGAGVWLLSSGGDPYSGSEHFALVRRGDRVLGYALGSAQVAEIRELDGRPGNEILLTSDEGSGRFLTATLFAPTPATVTTLADQIYHGQLSVIDLDGDPGLEMIVSGSSGDDFRFQDCNQCAKRRRGYILAFDPQRSRYRPVAALAGGADEAGSTSPNLFGMSGTMLAGVAEKDAGPALGRLLSSPQPADEDIGILLDHAYGLVDAGSYAAAVRLADRVAARLAPLRNVTPYQAGYLGAHIRAGFAELESGNAVAALRRLERLRVDGPKGPEDMLRSYWSLVAVTAMSLGDSTIAYEAMQKEQAIARPDQRSPGQGNLAMLYWHFGAWQAAGRQTMTALDLSAAEENWHGLALMMVNAAEAARREGDFASALDWLSRAFRLSRGFSNSSDTAFALQVAAAVALDARLPDLAMNLLDSGLLAYTPEIWRVRAPDHLLLYGRALEQKGDRAGADRAFRAATRLAETRGGLRVVEAWAEIGRSALNAGDRARAGQAYSEAFARIAAGRRSTPTDAYKIRYLENVDLVAERHFSLSAEAGGDARKLAEDLEAWKFQVFRDRYGQESVAAPKALEALRNRLKPNEAYVSYFLSPSISFATVVTRDKVSRRDLPIRAPEARRLRAGILKFMDLGDAVSAAYIRERKMPRALYDLLQAARDALVEPLDLGSGIDTLLINEDEDIAGLPWPAIPPNAAGWLDGLRWTLGFPRVESLLERYRVALLPSAYLVARPEPQAARGGRLVLAAATGRVPAATVRASLGVAGAEAAYGDLPPLPNGAAEVAAVQTGFGGPVTLLVDRAAAKHVGGNAQALTPPNLRLALAGTTAWHFVGHGVFNRIDPMGSAIFTGDSGGRGWINASEVAEWDLGGVRFVALSACETGTTQPEVGGETFGMVRALLGSGVRTTMVMGWPVDDLAASRFYKSFYAGIRHDSFVDAHRRATLELKRDFTHPFYWSMASLYGDWRS